MKLKIKLLKWSTGVPMAMLNEKTAEEIGVHAKERVFIQTLSKPCKKVSTIIDIVRGSIKKNKIAVSIELQERLDLKKEQQVEVKLAYSPKSLFFIKRKLDNFSLSEKEINEIIQDIVYNSLSDEEIALFISAMHKQGMSFQETIFLIKAILKSGNQLKLKNKFTADKHSIGGVPGNRTTPIVISICAMAGLTMPKTSSKAITSAAGTADVIETIAKVEFSMPQLKKILKKVNACMVWGGALEMVPADSRIIGIEKTLKIDPEAQLLASIMSKKLAAGSKYILIDIPYGKNAKVNKTQAKILKRKFEKLGKYFKKKLVCVFTNGSQPIGNGIGPALELIDIVNVLNQKKQGPKDLEKKSLFLAGKLLEMTNKAKKGKGIKLAQEILYSGKAFIKFKEIIKAQKGKISSLNKIKPAKYKKDFKYKTNGKILDIDNSKITFLAKLVGCPEDKFAGLYLYHHVGDKVKKKDKLLTIYAESRSRLRQAVKFYKKNPPIRLK